MYKIDTREIHAEMNFITWFVVVAKKEKIWEAQYVASSVAFL